MTTALWALYLAGRPTALLSVSPDCGSCAVTLNELNDLEIELTESGAALREEA